MREVQEEWEAKLRRGVNALCTELGVPLAREVCRRWGGGGGANVLASLSGRGNGRIGKGVSVCTTIAL